METKGKRDFQQPKDLSANSLEWAGSAAGTGLKGRIFTNVSFASIGLHPYICSLLEAAPEKGGFALKTATKVQSLTIPQMIDSKEKKSVLVKSQTGSGKTLTYLLPVIHGLMSIQPPVQRSDGTLALIVAPTRELCAQISDVLEKLCKIYVRIVPGSISGGEKKKSEKNRLRKGVTVLVGTPGRLLDHIKSTESFQLSNLRYVIVDEVDRLFDLGFDKTMSEIFGILHGTTGSSSGSLVQRWTQQTKVCRAAEELQFCMVSATVSPAVQRNAILWMKRFVLVDADRGFVSTPLQEEAELQQALSGRIAGVPVPEQEKGVLVMDDALDDEAAHQASSEVQAVPSTLRQFSMTVGLKWRLAALLAFLRLRRDQKVVVFFSTCDEVDFHGLLLRQLHWPKDLGPADPAAKDNGTSSSSAKNKSKSNNNNNNSKSKSSTNNGHNNGFGNANLDPLSWRFTSPMLSTSPESNDSPFIYRLHGKVPQQTRRQVQRDFAKQQSGVLLCTDVAARGLDLPQVHWILQYDAPSETMDYVHRIGRTARRGLAGSACLFLLPSESLYLHLLASSYGLTNLAPLSSQSMLTEAAKQIPLLQQKRFNNAEELAAVALQRHCEALVAANPILTQCAAQAFRSFVRAYGTRSADCKGIFKVQDLHLGHAAKNFALRDKPSELNAQSQDVIGRVFNADFASAATKKLLFPTPKPSATSATEADAKGAKKRKVSEEEGEEEEDDSDEVNAGENEPSDGEAEDASYVEGDEGNEETDEDHEETLMHSDAEGGDEEDRGRESKDSDDDNDEEEEEEEEEEQDDEQEEEAAVERALALRRSLKQQGQSKSAQLKEAKRRESSARVDGSKTTVGAKEIPVVKQRTETTKSTANDEESRPLVKRKLAFGAKFGDKHANKRRRLLNSSSTGLRGSKGWKGKEGSAVSSSAAHRKHKGRNSQRLLSEFAS